ncbi:MAG: hypothetical protein ACRCYU_14920 [Nocardioides sp.]
MPSYMVESKRQGMRATSNVARSMAWVQGDDGKRRPSKTEQARQVDEVTGEVGLPLWDVEVIYTAEAWGRVATATAMVTVGAAEEPTPGEFERITFAGLVVTCSPTKAGGLSERWTAEGIESGPGKRSASGSAAGGSAGA